ncbi:N/A [soil metagenome]
MSIESNFPSASIRALLLCDAVIVMAQMVGLMAVPWWIVHESGATDLAMYGVILAAGSLAALLLLAPLSERFPKRRQLVAGLALSALAALLLAMLTGRGRYNFPALIAVSVVAILADNLVTPVFAAITAELVDPTSLPAALRQRKTAQSVGRLLGPVVGGATIAVGGVSAALWLQFALFGVASIACLLLPSQKAQHATRRPPFSQWCADVKAGARAKWKVPIDRGWTAVNFVVWVFVGPAFGMLIPLKVQSLGLSASWLGACEAALSVGLFVGSVMGLPLLVARFGRLHVRVGAAVAEGVSLAIAGYVASPFLLMAAYACAGFANTLMVLVGATHRSLAVPLDFRVRMTAVNMMSSQIASSIGVALAGAALARWSVSHVYSLFGVIAAFGALLFLRIPRAAEFFALDHVHVVDWYKREYPTAFEAPPGRIRATRG